MEPQQHQDLYGVCSNSNAEIRILSSKLQKWSFGDQEDAKNGPSKKSRFACGSVLTYSSTSRAISVNPPLSLTSISMDAASEGVLSSVTEKAMHGGLLADG
jgi:hypothetical protein